MSNGGVRQTKPANAKVTPSPKPLKGVGFNSALLINQKPVCPEWILVRMIPQHQPLEAWKHTTSSYSSSVLGIAFT